MRFDLRRRLEIVARALATLGEAENSRALSRRLTDGSFLDWIEGEHGSHVWAEVEGAATLARRFAPVLPTEHRAAAVALERAFREAEALMADKPRPGAPRGAWRHERAIATVPSPSSELRRAA